MLFTVAQVAEYLHTHQKSVYRLVEDNKIPFIKQKGVGIRFKKSVIDKWLEEGSFYPAHIFFCSLVAGTHFYLLVPVSYVSLIV